jgi:drug/metabolite transporter (DMT)-like permease
MSPAVVLAALLAVVIWGASPVASKLALIDLPPLTLAVLRTVIAGGLTLPLALALRIAPPCGWSQRLVLLVSGFCGFAIFPYILTLGLTKTSANHASLILAALPVFTGAIAMAWDRRLPRPAWWLGCAIAFVGEMVLIGWKEGASSAPTSIAGDLLIVFANIFASLGYVAGGRLQAAGYPSTGTTYWGVVAASLVLLPAVPLAVGPVDWAQVRTVPLVALAYMAIGVTIVGYILWYWALGKGGIARMGLFQFLQPISGVLLATLLLAEPLTPSLIVAAGLVLSGVWIALKAKT